MPGATSAKFLTTPELGEGGPLSSTVLVPLFMDRCEVVFEAMRRPWVEMILSCDSESMLLMASRQCRTIRLF